MTPSEVPCGKCAAAPGGPCINGVTPAKNSHPQRVEEAKRRAKIQRDRADGQRFNRA